MLSEIPITPRVVAIPNSNPPVWAKEAIGATFQMNHAKSYVPVVISSINDDIKFFERTKT